MITAAEVARATYGAWRLARLDSGGLRFFGDTPEAFWRSFYAALVVVPGFAILVLLRLSENTVDSGAGRIFLVQSISYVIDWVAFPLVMIGVADRMGKFDRYRQYIVAHNWAAVIQMALFLAMTVVVYSGIAGRGLSVLVSLVTTLAILFYQWFIARVGLGVGALAAAGIVFIDLLISLILNGFTTRMM